MGKWAQGFYTPKNPKKYIGKHTPRYRSGWELTFMTFCDNNDSIIYWASESIKVPYRHPLTGKPTIYIPDFFVVYQNKRGQQVAEVVEIKPKKEVEMPEQNPKRRTKSWAYKVQTWVKNQAKWKAAREYCEDRKYEFIIMTEEDLFSK